MTSMSKQRNFTDEAAEWVRKNRGSGQLKMIASLAQLLSAIDQEARYMKLPYFLEWFKILLKRK